MRDQSLSSTRAGGLGTSDRTYKRESSPARCKRCRPTRISPCIAAPRTPTILGLTHRRSPSMGQSPGRREGGGASQDEGVLRDGLPPSEHLCGVFHHVLGTPQVVRGHGPSGGTSPVFRHGLHHLCPTPWRLVPTPAR